MKKLLVWILALSMLLSLAACSEVGKAGTEEGTKPAGSSTEAAQKTGAAAESHKATETATKNEAPSQSPAETVPAETEPPETEPVPTRFVESAYRIYDGEGTLTYSRTDEYDAAGRLLSQHYIKPSEERDYVLTNTYDDLGRMIRTERVGTGTLGQTDSWEYLDENDSYTETTTNADGSLYRVYTQKLTAAGKILSIDEAYYDENGRMSSEEHEVRTEEGTRVRRTEAKVKDKKAVLSEETFFENGKNKSLTEYWLETPDLPETWDSLADLIRGSEKTYIYREVRGDEHGNETYHHIHYTPIAWTSGTGPTYDQSEENTFVYNEHGDITYHKKVTINEFNSGDTDTTIYSFTYEYNDAGLMTHSIENAELTDNHYERFYRYDDKGRLTYESYGYPGKDISSYKEYEYNDENLIRYAEYEIVSGKAQLKVEKTYTEQGYAEHTVRYSSSGVFRSEVVYYPTPVWPNNYSLSYKADHSIDRGTSAEFDENWNVIHTEKYENGVKTEIRDYTWDEHGNETERRISNGEGTLQERYVWEYIEIPDSDQ